MAVVLVLMWQGAQAAPDGGSSALKQSIFEAVAQNDLVSLNLLLDQGTNVDTVDKDGNTALILAAEAGNPRILSVLMTHGADVNLQNFKGETALMIAAQNGQEYYVKKLINHGAHTCVKNLDGQSAADLANMYGFPNLADWIKGKRLSS